MLQLLNFLKVFLMLVLLFVQHAQAQTLLSRPAVLMPAVRRVGIDSVQHNLFSFRQNQNQDVSKLRGFAAAVLGGDDQTREELQKLLYQAAKKSGRFWILPFEPGVLTSNAKRDLARRYDLDAWLNVDVQFAPDNTLIRIRLVAAGEVFSTLVREDVLTSAQATSAEIGQAMEKAIQRIIVTLSHDGKVTYHRQDLINVDFGEESLITVGQKLYAGFVTLAQSHPITGEYLQVKNKKIYGLEVISVRPGSALCRIVSTDNIALQEYAPKSKNMNLTSLPPLLVWKELKKQDEEQRWYDADMRDSKAVIGSAAPGYALPINARQVAQENFNVDGQPMDATAAADTTTKSSSIDEILNWKIQKLYIGGGILFGRANRLSENTKISNILFNSVQATAQIEMSPSWSLYPVANYALYAGKVTGSGFYFEGMAKTFLFQESTLPPHWAVGGGVVGSTGRATVDSVGTSLDLFQVAGTVSYERVWSGVGLWRAGSILHIVNLLEGSLAGSLEASLLLDSKRSVPAGKFEIGGWGFNLRLRQSSKSWSEVFLGTQLRFF